MRIHIIISIFFFTLGLINFTHILPSQKNQEHKTVAATKKESKPEEKEITLEDDSLSQDYRVVTYSQRVIAVAKPPVRNNLIASNKVQTGKHSSSFTSSAPAPSAPPPAPASVPNPPASQPEHKEEHREYHHKDHHSKHREVHNHKHKD